jgi:eukaryotic-like serine/threonine-protein kinase
MRQIQKGLGEAHALGIVHRDLKPANIFLATVGDDEVVKILDFGIAKETKGLTVEDDRTKSGTVLGSPHHMSPEQARGGDIDTRSDLWSLGVVFFRVLTGEKPFGGTNMGDIIAKICGDAIPTASSFAPWLGPSVDAFFERALRRNPDLRFQSVREMAEAFDEAVGIAKSPSESRRPSPITDPSAAELASVIVPRADVTRDVAARTSIADSEPTAIGTASDKPFRASKDARPLPRLAFSVLVLIAVAGTVVFSWLRFGPHASPTPSASATDTTALTKTVQDSASTEGPTLTSPAQGNAVPTVTASSLPTSLVSVTSASPVASASEAPVRNTGRPVPQIRHSSGPAKPKGDPFF